jgi:sigma-E factor negative regulatory protein RseA
MDDKTQLGLAMDIAVREAVSDLADGRLRGEAFATAVEMAGSGSEGREGREVWHRYHLIGDVMRGVDTVAVDGGLGFVSRFRGKLALEQDLSRTPEVTEVPAVAGFAKTSDNSANDSIFRWRMVAGMASLTAILAVGWNMVESSKVESAVRMALSADSQAGQAISSQVAAKSPATDKGPPVMLRDPHLDALMAAHKQFGGTSALQMPAGFIRNATFESNDK